MDTNGYEWTRVGRLLLMAAMLPPVGFAAESTPPPNPDGLLDCQQGNLPIILLAPHGGTVEPPGMTPRKGNPLRDSGTAELAQELAKALSYTNAAGVERKPYFVINRLHRKFVDPNRSPQKDPFSGLTDENGQRLQPDPRAQRLYHDFHACADFAVGEVQREFGAGLLLDLHGLAAARTLDMYGYILRGADFRDPEDPKRPASDEQLASAILTRSTLRAAAARKQNAHEIAGLVHGPDCLASLMDKAYRELYPDRVDENGSARGRPATPSLQYPDPKGESISGADAKVYFNGSYDISSHGSLRPGIQVDAVQVETTKDARSAAADRQRFAQAMTVAVRRFVKLHYDLDIYPPQ
ncbi:MAG: N-formylglutamate amidohydrolase [Candidatus Sumerlaeota bacterium]|nr:N-formylglutamate amidohydrolase [Candidatus Sumerlaeota bacterium]